MPKKKIAKYHQDIAAAQAISGKAPTHIDRCEWWSRLSKASTQEQIRAVLNTPMLPEITDEDAPLTGEDL